MRGASTCIALVVGADIMLLFGRKTVCRAKVQLFAAVGAIEQAGK